MATIMVKIWVGGRRRPDCHSNPQDSEPKWNSCSGQALLSLRPSAYSESKPCRCFGLIQQKCEVLNFIELSSSDPNTSQNSKTQPTSAIVYLIDYARCK